MSNIKISDELSVPLDEIKILASRSSGPGGQNVNKVSTRVTLLFEVINSPSLTDHQKGLIRKHLATRINKAGILRVSSQKHRNQALNREAALERLVLLLQGSLREEPPRKRTKIPKAAKEIRLDEKKQRSRIKERRSKPILLDD